MPGDEINDSSTPMMIRDPAGRYHNPDGSKFNTADEALAHFMQRCNRHPRPAA